MTSSLLGRVLVKILHQQWPRADDTHVPLQHVPKLGQFVQARTPQEAAEGRKALRVREKVTLRVARIRHRAELAERERAAVAAGTDLPEQDRAAFPQTHAERN